MPALDPLLVPAKVTSLPKRQAGDFLENPMAVLLSTGDIVGWGDNTHGGLANGIASATNAPIQKVLFDPNTTLPPFDATVVDWVITNANMYIVFSNGWVYSAGKNALGQLGHGDTVARNQLKRIEYFVANGKSIAKVWASGNTRLTDGGGCAYFQSTDFAVCACGAGANGNLGNAAQPTANLFDSQFECTGLPVTPNRVVDIVLGAGRTGFSAYALFNDGMLKVAGANLVGQLGTGAITNVTGGFVNATKLGGTNITNAVSVSMTTGVPNNGLSGSALIVDASGNVWTTGRNAFGQLGLGNTVGSLAFRTGYGTDKHCQS